MTNVENIEDTKYLSTESRIGVDMELKICRKLDTPLNETTKT
jgi:hypothetical protein